MLLLLRRAREARSLRRLLLLLLLELLLVLSRDRRHRGRTGLEALLRLSLSREPGILRLLRLGLLHGAWVTGVLLLERSLAEARGLRSEGAGLLALLALLASHGVEGASILGCAGPLAAGAAEEGVGVRIHRGLELTLLLRHGSVVTHEGSD